MDIAAKFFQETLLEIRICNGEKGKANLTTTEFENRSFKKTLIDFNIEANKLLKLTNV